MNRVPLKSVSADQADERVHRMLHSVAPGATCGATWRAKDSWSQATSVSARAQPRSPSSRRASLAENESLVVP